MDPFHAVTIFEGDQVAAVCGARVWLAPWVLALSPADELRRRVTWRCMVAGAIVRGEVPGPYSDALADAAARALLVDRAALKTTRAPAGTEALAEGQKPARAPSSNA